MVLDFKGLTEKVQAQALELEFIKIVLKNSRSEFIGAGRINQHADGRFDITIYPDVAGLDFLRIKDSHFLSNPVPSGNYLGQESYFSFEGVSLVGVKWHAHDVWVTADVNHAYNGLILRAQVTQLYSYSDQPTTPSYFQKTTAIHKNFRFPCNSFSSSANSKIRNVAEFDIQGVSCRVIIHRDTVDIETRADEPILTQFHRGLVNSLQLVAASQMELIASHEKINKTWIYHLSAVQADIRLWSGESPIGVDSPAEFADCVSALEKLLGCFLEDDTPRFWPLYADFTQSYFTGQNAVSLAVSVAVEGVADAYYQRYSNADPAHLEECLAAIPSFKLLVSEHPELFSIKVISRITSSLRSAGRASNKNTLFFLFSEALVNNWNSIRHVSAHGLEGQLGDQKIYDCICSCLYMFYSMLFAYAGYTGPIIDIAGKQGVPVDNPVVEKIANFNAI